MHSSPRHTCLHTDTDANLVRATHGSQGARQCSQLALLLGPGLEAAPPDRQQPCAWAATRLLTPPGAGLSLLSQHQVMLCAALSHSNVAPLNQRPWLLWAPFRHKACPGPVQPPLFPSPQNGTVPQGTSCVPDHREVTLPRGTAHRRKSRARTQADCNLPKALSEMQPNG